MEGTKAGETRTLGGIEMVWCPPGDFLMGSPESENDRGDDEKQHRVTLTRGFWLAKTETTQGQWKSVMGTTPAEQRAKGDSLVEAKLTGGTGSTHPMYFVNWEDAIAYCEKLNREPPLAAGWKWALPSEAQWEYACRAGTTEAYAGDLDGLGWYLNNSDSQTHPVGMKKANPWGLVDMHGNVYEWCQDWYGKDFYSDEQTDPTGAANGFERVQRGGGRANRAQLCRSAIRNKSTPTRYNSQRGFRVAVSSSQ